MGCPIDDALTQQNWLVKRRAGRRSFIINCCTLEAQKRGSERIVGKFGGGVRTGIPFANPCDMRQ